MFFVRRVYNKGRREYLFNRITQMRRIGAHDIDAPPYISLEAPKNSGK